jgi:ABC-type enterobactin transport system permease subunit
MRFLNHRLERVEGSIGAVSRDQLGMRCCRRRQSGALLLAGADYLAQRAFAPTQLPVGIVTVSIGGLYFAWLLMREARR